MAKFLFTVPDDVSIDVSSGGNKFAVTLTPVAERMPVMVLQGGIKGDKGDPGLSGGGETLLTAPIDLGGNRVVMANGYYADNLDLTTVNKAIGLTQSAAVTGATVVIVTARDLDGFTGLTANNPVYLSANGTITQNVPNSGYIQQIGVAISTTKILVNLQPAIVQ